MATSAARRGKRARPPEGGKHATSVGVDGGPDVGGVFGTCRSAGFAGIRRPAGAERRSRRKGRCGSRGTGRSSRARARSCRTKGRSGAARSRRRRRREGRYKAHRERPEQQGHRSRRRSQKVTPARKVLRVRKVQARPGRTRWRPWRSRRTWRHDAARRDRRNPRRGNCNADEIMVSALCVGAAVVATASDNGATCGREAPRRDSSARRSNRQQRSRPAPYGAGFVFRALP